MRDTYLLLDEDFCADSTYRSWEAEAKLANWFEWAEAHLHEKDLKEIERAIRKL
jgi:hypothetical protein